MNKCKDLHSKQLKVLHLCLLYKLVLAAQKHITFATYSVRSILIHLHFINHKINALLSFSASPYYS